MMYLLSREKGKSFANEQEVGRYALQLHSSITTRLSKQVTAIKHARFMLHEIYNAQKTYFSFTLLEEVLYKQISEL